MSRVARAFHRIPRERRWAVALVALALVLVLVRGAAAVSLSDTFFETRYETYDDLAQSLRNGEGFSVEGEPFVFELPVYPLLVAGAYGIGGRDWWSVAALQTLIDLASLLLVVALGRRLFGPAVGLVAGALFAVYPYLASQSAQLIDTSVFTLTLLAFLYFVVRSAESGRLWDAAAAGAAAGLGYLVRPTVLAVAVAMPLLLALLGARRGAVWRTTAVAAAVALVVLVPWTVRNAVQFEAFQPGAAKAGTNFWKGNSPHSSEFIEDGKNLDLLPFLPDSPKPPPGLDPLETDDWWFEQGRDWIWDHPGAWAEGLGVKFVAFWSWELNPRSTADTTFKRAVYTASYAPVLALALIGALLVVLRRRVRRLAFLLVPIVLFTAVHLLIFGYTRLRAPLDPLLMMLAGVALVEAAVAVRRSAWRPRSTARRAEAGRARARSA